MASNETEFSQGVAKFLQQLKTNVIRILDDAANDIFKGSQSNGRRIPGSITLDDFREIRNRLARIRDDTGADIVNMRLNSTDIDRPAPVFVGWVESDRIKEIRAQRNEPDPGLYRFGDTVAAREYDETLNAKGAMKERDWTVEVTKKSGEQKALVLKAGVVYQKLIGIVVHQGNGRRCVGTLNFGFSGTPDQARQKAERVNNVIENWAREGSDLVKFLKSNFELGGPTF